MMTTMSNMIIRKLHLLFWKTIKVLGVFPWIFVIVVAFRYYFQYIRLKWLIPKPWPEWNCPYHSEYTKKKNKKKDLMACAWLLLTLMCFWSLPSSAWFHYICLELYKCAKSFFFLEISQIGLFKSQCCQYAAFSADQRSNSSFLATAPVQANSAAIQTWRGWTLSVSLHFTQQPVESDPFKFQQQQIYFGTKSLSALQRCSVRLCVSRFFVCSTSNTN